MAGIDLIHFIDGIDRRNIWQMFVHAMRVSFFVCKFTHRHFEMCQQQRCVTNRTDFAWQMCLPNTNQITNHNGEVNFHFDLCFSS